MIDIVMVVLIIITLVVIAVMLLKRKDTSLKEQESYSYRSICDGFVKWVNELVATSRMGMGLSDTILQNQDSQSLTILKSIRMCCSGDVGAREAMKELARTYLSRVRGIDEKNILLVVPFHNPKAMSARQLFEAMLYKLDGGEDLGFAKLRDEYGWGITFSEDCCITEEDVRATWDSLRLRFSFAEQLNVLAQMVYADCYGLSVLDSLNQQKMSIEEIQGGMSGLPEEAYQYKNEIIGAKQQKTEYSKDSIHIVVRGNTVRLSFLSFETKEELRRVIQNLMRSSNAGELTIAAPILRFDTSDGRRITVGRPPAVETWCVLIRKFDAALETNLYEWCSEMKRYTTVADTIKWLVKAGAKIAFTGEMLAGKTTVLRAALSETDVNKTIRTIEGGSFELDLRRFLPGRNTLAFRVTSAVTEEDVLAIVRSTSGQIFSIGEVNSARMANITMECSKFSEQVFFTAQYVSSEDMVAAFTDAKLCVGGYSNEKLAEMDAVSALGFDIHVAKQDGVRYVPYINEIVPVYGCESDYDTETISEKNATVKLAAGIREVRKQLGKIRTYEVRPILSYDIEDGVLYLHNPPSIHSMKKAKAYMKQEQYQLFVNFFEEFYPKEQTGGDAS